MGVLVGLGVCGQTGRMGVLGPAGCAEVTDLQSKIVAEIEPDDEPIGIGGIKGHETRNK